MALIFVGSPDIDPIYFQGSKNASWKAPYQDFDTFLGFNRKTEAEKQERKEKRKAFWSKLSGNVKQSGGAEGIGRTIDNLAGLFSKPAEQPEQDYTITPIDEEKEKNETLSTPTIIVGSVVILAVVGLGFMYVSKSKKAAS